MKAGKDKIPAAVVGNIGMYYVCYQLSRMNWNVMPTARNARGIDIVAYNQDGSRYIGIQVKSLSKKSPVPLGKTLEKIMGDFWIIVNNVLEVPNVFVLLPQEVKARARRGEKDGRVSYWLQPKEYDCEEFNDAWRRLGQ